MDEILIAPRVLTAAEIRAMFSVGASGLCRPATGCVDYKVSGVTAPARAVMGVAGFRVQAFVENEGTLAAPASTLTVYLVREGSGERIVAGSIAVGALGPQQSLRVGASLPLFVAAGSYQVVVEAPLSGDCAPENNSVTVEEPMQVIAATAAGPDLLVASLGAVADTVVCNRLEVVATVANQGAAMRDAEGFRVGLYLSVDRVLTAADPLVGYCDMAPLGAGGVRRCSAGSLFIQTPGEYTLFARVDDRTSTTDVNRQNNVNSIPLSVKACPAP
jgi:subtilase family serine protease